MELEKPLLQGNTFQIFKLLVDSWHGWLDINKKFIFVKFSRMSPILVQI